MPEVKDYIRRMDTLEAGRKTTDSVLQEIGNLVYPRRADFTVQQTPGAKRNLDIYDSTPVFANELLAAGMHGMLTNPATEWFSLGVPVSLQQDEDVLEWLDIVMRIINSEMTRSEAGFTTNMHEDYMEYGAYGTSCLFIGENLDADSLVFDSRPLHENYIAENAFGIVDTVYRRFNWTVRQVVAKWKLEGVSEATRKKYNAQKWDEKVSIIHAIQPRTDFNPAKKDKANLPIASVYLERQAKHKLEEGGFHEMPMLVSRFYKAAGEIYGRSPSWTVLPDVKMLNEMAKSTIKAAQKVVDPPLQVPDDGFLGPTVTIPGGLNYYRAGTKDRIEAIKTDANIPVGLELMNELRVRIKEAYFIDQLQLQQGPQMTATEVLQRTEEKLRLLGPVLGRYTTEKLGPMLDRVLGLLWRQGKIPTPPPQLEPGTRLKIEFVGPIARAQKQLEGQGILQTLEILRPFFEQDPEQLNVFDKDRMTKDVALDLYGVRPSWLKSQEKIDAQREEDKQMVQAQQLAEIASKAGQGVNQLSQANAAGEEAAQ